MGLFRSKDKSSSLTHSTHSTKTTGPAAAFASKTANASGTYAEKGGRAAASTRHGSTWSKSVAYGGDYSDSNSHHHHHQQVSSQRFHYTYTTGNASAGLTKGGTYAQAGKGGYGEAVWMDGERFSASVADGRGTGKGKGGQLGSGGELQSMIELSCYESSDEGEDSDG